ALVFAVVEGRLELFAAPPATPAAATTPSPGPSALLLIGLSLALLSLGLFGLSLLGCCCLDLGFDLVAEVDFARAGVFIIRREVVLLAELAKFGRADFKLVGDPGIGPPLSHPGADLVELRLQRASSHRRASLFNGAILRGVVVADSMTV